MGSWAGPQMAILVPWCNISPGMCLRCRPFCKVEKEIVLRLRASSLGKYGLSTAFLDPFSHRINRKFSRALFRVSFSPVTIDGDVEIGFFWSAIGVKKGCARAHGVRERKILPAVQFWARGRCDVPSQTSRIRLGAFVGGGAGQRARAECRPAVNGTSLCQVARPTFAKPLYFFGPCNIFLDLS